MSRDNPIKPYDIIDEDDKITDLKLLLYYAEFCIYRHTNKKKNMKKLKKIIQSKERGDSKHEE